MDELRCPSCGADISFRGGDLTVCPYCGSQLYFGSGADPAELTELRNINQGYRQVYSPEAVEYAQKMKKWQKGNGISMGLLMLFMIAAELITLFCSKTFGGAFLFLALGIAIFMPMIRGIRYPVRETESGAGKKIGVTLAMYALAVGSVIAAVITGAIIAVIFGYDPNDKKDSGKSSPKAETSYSDDCDEFVSEWFKLNYSVDDDELLDFYGMQCPDDIWEDDMDSEDTAMMIEYQKVHTQAALKSYDISLTECEKLEELTDEEILGAESYFSDRFDTDIEVTEGYGYHAVFTAKPKEKGKSKEYNDYCCAVRLKGSDGWKIIPLDAEELKDYSDYYDDDPAGEYTDDYDEE